MAKVTPLRDAACLCTIAFLCVYLVRAGSDSTCDSDSEGSTCSGTVEDQSVLLQHGTLRSLQASTSSALPTCGCETANPAWSKPNRSEGQCVFIDLGANNGNTFDVFLAGGYVNLSECPNSKWEAFLVEANPRFDEPLQEISRKHPSAHSLCPQAAFYCEGQTQFFLDEVNEKQSYWGSSMSDKHRDVVKTGGKSVHVDTVNVARMLYENTIPEDVVVLKMDIEGSEWDIVPCLARSPTATLMDYFFCEVHPMSYSSSGKASWSDFQNAKQHLLEIGIKIPEYHSSTL